MHSKCLFYPKARIFCPPCCSRRHIITLSLSFQYFDSTLVRKMSRPHSFILGALLGFAVTCVYFLGSPAIRIRFPALHGTALVFQVHTGTDDLTHQGRDNNGRHSADDVFMCIFSNESLCIVTEISLNYDSREPINNISVLVHIMVCCLFGAKPLLETGRALYFLHKYTRHSDTKS